MNALEKAQELIENGKNVPKRTLFVAYIAFHMENPALHPDDHLRNDEYNPYTGWEVILCNLVVNLLDKSPTQELVHYPSSFLKLADVLEELNDQLEAEYRRTDADSDYQIWGNVEDVTDFINDMDTKNIHLAYEALLKLYLHIADENDTADEESEKPAGVLKECHDALLWIAQQPNDTPKPKKVFTTISELGEYCIDACHDGVVKVRVEASCTTGEDLEPQEFMFNVGGSEEFQTLLETIDVMTQFNYNLFSYTLV